MKKNTKKKVLTLTLVILLLSIAIVGGSLAWFTAEDEATNVFTVGSIKIKQNEYQLDENGEKIPYENENKVFMPVVDMDNFSEDPNYQDKIVDVTNTGTNPAYIRTHIAVPVELKDYLILDDNQTDWELINPEGNVTVVGEKKYTVYTYMYKHELQPGKTTESEVLKGVYLHAKTDVQKNPRTGDLEFCYRDERTGDFNFSNYSVTDANNKVNVLVLTQAVQAEGFDNPKQALVAAFNEEIPEFTI